MDGPLSKILKVFIVSPIIFFLPFSNKSVVSVRVSFIHVFSHTGTNSSFHFRTKKKLAGNKAIFFGLSCTLSVDYLLLNVFTVLKVQYLQLKWVHIINSKTNTHTKLIHIILPLHTFKLIESSVKKLIIRWICSRSNRGLLQHCTRQSPWITWHRHRKHHFIPTGRLQSRCYPTNRLFACKLFN